MACSSTTRAGCTARPAGGLTACRLGSAGANPARPLSPASPNRRQRRVSGYRMEPSVSSRGAWRVGHAAERLKLTPTRRGLLEPFVRDCRGCGAFGRKLATGAGTNPGTLLIHSFVPMPFRAHDGSTARIVRTARGRSLRVFRHGRIRPGDPVHVTIQNAPPDAITRGGIVCDDAWPLAVEQLQADGTWQGVVVPRRASCIGVDGMLFQPGQRSPKPCRSVLTSARTARLTRCHFRTYVLECGHHPINAES
jgi:hypothetical protein